jgi:hypothetical protein
VRGQYCIQRMVASTEAKEIGLECHPGDDKAVTLPSSPNHREGTVKRRMKMERREK